MESPCRDSCQLNDQNEICTGCGRTLEEIAAWSTMTAAERSAVMARLAQASRATATRQNR